MSTKLSDGAASLLERLKKDCINYTRVSRKTRAYIEELNDAGYFVQTENTLHEGYWVTYYPDAKSAR